MCRAIAAYDERFAFLFNSYYEAEGERHARPKRGMLSRPSLDEVRDWRAHVDEALERALPSLSPEALELIELGINHEQQHQELFLTDILATFAENPIEPAYAELAAPACFATEPLTFHPGRTGIVEIGARERRLRVRLRAAAPPRLPPPASQLPAARSPTANGPSSSPTAAIRRRRSGSARAGTGCRREGIAAPLYWNGDGTAFTLAGRREIDRAAPVAHVSYYEADAFARWAGARLPTEAEWESFAESADPFLGNQLDEAEAVLPKPGGGIFGDAWEWTASAYLAYPGLRSRRGRGRRI